LNLLIFSRRTLGVLGACLISLLGAPLSGRRAQLPQGPAPEFQDWTTKHVVYPRVGPMEAMQSAARDPRAMLVWGRAQREFGRWWDAERRLPEPPFRFRPVPRPEAPPFQTDWSINLGTGGTAPAMFPAKFTFDTTAAPSCANDFIVFPVNAVGAAAQPNIVAFSNLYSGTAGGNGICNRTPTGSDTGISATVLWSYNVAGIAGGSAVTTSPVISYDPVTPAASGTKVAFVESAATGQIKTASITAGHAGTGYVVGDAGTISGGTGVLATYRVLTVTAGAVTSFTITYAGTGYSVVAGAATVATSGTGTGFEISVTAVTSVNAAHFHVLAWGTGASNGQNASNLQSVLSPATISTFSATTPAAGSGTATDLAFSTHPDTLSSPFVDYVRDVVYVGDDAGVLYRLKNVFCTSVNPNCAPKPVPSLDASWGTGGAVTIGGTCIGKLTGPVLDFVTLNVFVGCADGKLYRVTQAGAVSSVTVGNGTAFGGIVDPPIVDGVNGFVYAVSGSNGTNAVLVQAKTNFSATSTATLGGAGFRNVHAPAFNDPYYSSATTTTWLVYAAAFDATDANLELYGVTFNASGTMTAGTPAHTFALGTRVGEMCPLAEFKNGATDWLFLSVAVVPPDIGQLNINAFPAAVTTASNGNGTSAMVVDNASASIQASSFYFTTISTNTAVKLTQAGLQ
jgi:hypothetical protein